MESIEHYLEKPPYEIWVKILSQLDSHDVLKCCVAYPPHCRFLRDRKLIRTLDFSMEFNLNVSLIDDLMPNVEPSYVTVFNVNGLYWIPAEELRSCIKQFHNLECLCVLGTTMYVSDEDGICLSSLPKLQKVAINMSKLHITDKTSHCFPRVKSLMLYLIGDEAYSLVKRLASDLCVEDLWIISKYRHSTSVREVVLEMCVKRFVHHYTRQSIDANQLAFNLVGDLTSLPPAFHYMNLDCGIVHVDRTYSGPISDIPMNAPLRSWISLRHDCPLGIEDIKMYLRGDASYCVKELNFYHLDSEYCAERLYATAVCIDSPLVKKLQKLSFKSCSVEDAYHPQLDKNGLVKKRRSTHDIQLNQVGIQFPNLTELAIFRNCWDVPTNSNLDYGTISNLKYLEKLTLSVLQPTPPHFIVDVLQKCTELKVLTIHCTSNEPFMESLYSAMTFAKKLRDFRCKVSCTRLDVDKLFVGLNSTEDLKLERLTLEANESRISNTTHIADFLERNPQLIFVYLFMKGIRDRLLRIIRNDLSRFERANISTSSKKLFIVTKLGYELNNLLGVADLSPIPEIHLQEMLYCPANRPIRDICRDFMLSDYTIC